jgi:hypothetical protein
MGRHFILRTKADTVRGPDSLVDESPPMMAGLLYHGSPVSANSK